MSVTFNEKRCSLKRIPVNFLKLKDKEKYLTKSGRK